MIRVAIIGPESTGKTALAKALAEKYDTLWVPEYARQYLESLGRPYVQNDLIDIARGQMEAQRVFMKGAKRLLFTDTDLHVIRIWSEFKYGNCDPWILQQLELQHFDLYILTYYDIPYEEDPLRENPDSRPELFDLYHDLLTERKLPFVVVKGDHESRMKQASRRINPLL